MLHLLSQVGHLRDAQGTADDWSPQRLQAEVRQRSTALQGLVSDGEPNRFVIAHGNSAAFFADLFAVWQVGGCAVCVNPSLTAGELANVTGFVQARAVLVDDGAGPSAAQVAALPGVPVLCTAREAARRAAGHPARRATLVAGQPAALDDDALILFTSGTTGDPKGVVHSHRSLLARLALNQAQIGRAALARALCVLPTHFGHGLIGNALTPLLAGGDLSLMPNAGVAGTARLAEVIERQRITFMSSVPAFWKLALRTSPAPQPGILQRVHIGSAPLSAELWRGVMAWTGTRAVANTYGITETANWIGGALATEVEPEDGLVGRAWGGSIAVAGGDGLPCAEGEGEVLVQTPSLMRGYFNRTDLTAEVLADGWYRTGDHGQLDAHGLLRLTGRDKYMINRGGIKVYPEEIDLLFERHPQVLEACAFAVPDAVAGEAVGLALRLKDDAELPPPTGADFTRWARERIRPDAVPARIFIVADIPKTDRGKLNRATVANACLQPARRP